MEKVVSKLEGWKSKQLSMAGRTILICSVISALPSYTMQVFLMPSTLCDKLDRMARKFLWGVNEERRNFLTLQSWNNICVRKLTRGLGIRQFKEANIAYITKLGWKLCTEGNRIWVNLIRSKYLRGR